MTGLSRLENLKAVGVFGLPAHKMALKLQVDLDGRQEGPLEFRIPEQFASHPQAIMMHVSTRMTEI